MDTIFAVATARGKAGVAIVRLSGRQSHAAVVALAGDLPDMRRASLRRLRWRGEVLDDALICVFAEGASFTGEQSAELHLHGGGAVCAAVLRALSELPEMRLAGPGEFTRRALENGRLDLAQVEGLADLIDAETEAQRKQAFRVLSGAVGLRAEAWRLDLIRAAALLEVTIDFADEDVPVDVAPEVIVLIDRLLGDLAHEVEGSRSAERIRDGFEVAIIGRPNTGKSTLLNALAGRDAAITSEIAGTTRDVIEVRMDLDGLAVTLLDTAGLRPSDDIVESAGIARALDRAETADLRVFLLDERGLPDGIKPTGDDIVVYGKADLPGRPGFAVSGHTGAGIPELVARISGLLSERASRAATITRERHRQAVQRAIEALGIARLEVTREAFQPEIVAEHLRATIRALDSLVGRVDVETLLGEIFSRFCIGK